jgi:tetratricopeptide (TPR) repeat protein
MSETTSLEEKLRQANELYFSLYEKLKKWAKAVWEENIVVHEQIKHGISHSDKIAQYAGIILQNKLQTNTLNPEELFLLDASVYLHDIGMQTGWKEFLEIKGTIGQLTKEERFLIRKKHAETSAFVIRSWQTRLPDSLDRELTPVEKDLLCRDFSEPLAFTCQCHNHPAVAAFLDTELNQNHRFRDRGFNIALPAALLQLCDALDMDQNRLIPGRFKDNLGKWLEDQPLEVIYDDNDWKRFFQCHFVEKVRVVPVFQGKDVFQISIDARFNREEDREIRDRFLDIYWKRLQKTRHDCVTVLNQTAGIHFLSDYPFNILDANSVKEKIPAKLVHLFRREEKDSKEEKIPPGQGPAAKTGLVGRDRDIKKLQELILKMRETGPKKVITLKGAPGIGKTALARALLPQEDILHHFSHGCRFIPLEGVETKENLVLQINTRLGISQNAEEAPLLNYIADKNILIILDNFEDPLTDRSETLGLLRRLLGQCRFAVIVCTSREALRDAAVEVIHPVDRLDRRSSKELLISLACAQGCDEELSDKDLEALLEELADIPLAISLAAPYLVYGCQRLLEEIKTRGVEPLEIMGIAKDSRDKYTSLDRCFWLSYRTIAGSDADRLFQAASLFPAGFTREDTEALLPGLAFHHFITLESKSLLAQHQPGEFSLLAPLRHYAFQIFLHRSRPDDMEKHWLKLVIRKSLEYENTVHGKGSKPLNRLIQELPNIYMPLDYLLQEASQRPGLKENIFELLGNMVDFWRFQGIYRQAKDYLETAGRLAKEAADTANEAYCIRKLGEIFFYESRNRDAMAALQQALPLYQKIGHLLGEANCIRGMGDIHFLESRNRDAMAAFQQALPLYQKIGDLLGEANCIRSMGEIHFVEWRNRDAMAAFQQALPLYQKIGDLLGEANCVSSSGQIHIKTGNLKKGKNHLEQALNLYNTINSQYSIAKACYEYALLLKEIKGQKKQARQLFQKAGQILAAIDLPQYADKCKKYAGEISA